jgi:hypothetical protein
LLIEPTHGAEALVQHHGRLPKQCVFQERIDITKDGMFQKIKGLGPELNSHRFYGMKFFAECRIDLNGI